MTDPPLVYSCKNLFWTEMFESCLCGDIRMMSEGVSPPLIKGGLMFL